MKNNTIKWEDKNMEGKFVRVSAYAKEAMQDELTRSAHPYRRVLIAACREINGKGQVLTCNPLRRYLEDRYDRPFSTTFVSRWLRQFRKEGKVKRIRKGEYVWLEEKKQ